MKRKPKYFLIGILVIIILIPIIFRNRILLYYDLYKRYSSYKDETASIDYPGDLFVDVDINKDTINYKDTNNVKLNLDLYRPTKIPLKGSPVILYVHGGSWAYGDNYIPQILSPLLETFLDRGYSIISVSYELLNKDIDFSKQVCDVKDSIRWIYKNKDTYNFNTNEIGVIGVSAGAHLAMLATYSDEGEFVDSKDLADYPTNIKYLLDFFGPTDLSTLDESIATDEINNALKNIGNKEEYTKKFSPINYVKEGLPKTIIIHSKVDTMVPYDNSLSLYTKSKALGNDVKLVTVNDMNHDLSNISEEDTMTIAKEVLTFLVNNAPL